MIVIARVEMGKSKKTQFICHSCGHVSLRWLGRCPDCNKWDSLVEEAVISKKEKQHLTFAASQPELINDITATDYQRLSTRIGEFDRVLGGGIVPGSVTLIAGDPGIGKSTLLLQASNELSLHHGIVLYVSGEESVSQTKLRANRLDIESNSLYVLCENSLEQIESHISSLNPSVIVVDSIQTVFQPHLQSAPGSVTQVRESAGHLLVLAKTKNVPVILVGHVTKEGALAGPKVLEHMVDTVLYFEGENHHVYRVLRAVKNRFGSTNEIGVFEMSASGLSEVLNPSELFISNRVENISGSVVVSSMEGTRPILFELQALVAPSNFNIPRNTATGVDRQRIALLVAVLQKRVGFEIGNSDVFVNVTGGMRVDERGVDLGTIMAIASNHRDIPISTNTVVMGEVGLGGEIRPVTHISRRLREANKLGFSRAVFPEYNLSNYLADTDKQAREDIELVGVTDLYGAISALL